MLFLESGSKAGKKMQSERSILRLAEGALNCARIGWVVLLVPFALVAIVPLTCIHLLMRGVMSGD
jgi:hypothetical protein